jgi:hypothetical protein
LKKEKRCKSKGYVIYSQNNNRKFPKSQERFARSGTGSLQDTNRLDQNRTSPWHIIIKTSNTENRERILKAIREKKQITYKVKRIKITADFSTENLKARSAWSEVFCVLKENNFSLRILYLEKLSFKTDRGIKVFHDKQKLNNI